MMKPILNGIQHEFGARGPVVLEVGNGAIDMREALAKEVGQRPADRGGLEMGDVVFSLDSINGHS